MNLCEFGVLCTICDGLDCDIAAVSKSIPHPGRIGAGADRVDKGIASRQPGVVVADDLVAEHAVSYHFQSRRSRIDECGQIPGRRRCRIVEVAQVKAKKIGSCLARVEPEYCVLLSPALKSLEPLGGYIDGVIARTQ